MELRTLLFETAGEHNTDATLQIAWVAGVGVGHPASGRCILARRDCAERTGHLRPGQHPGNRRHDLSQLRDGGLDDGRSDESRAYEAGRDRPYGH